eukprot:scaffold11809_cov114-Isochrysis_galbana.AAC.2
MLSSCWAHLLSGCRRAWAARSWKSGVVMARMSLADSCCRSPAMLYPFITRKAGRKKSPETITESAPATCERRHERPRAACWASRPRPATGRLPWLDPKIDLRHGG